LVLVQANVLLGRVLAEKNMQVKIADFGWAIYLGDANKGLNNFSLSGGIAAICARPPEIWLARGSIFLNRKWVATPRALSHAFEFELLIQDTYNALRFKVFSDALISCRLISFTSGILIPSMLGHLELSCSS
jgi:hypothetical protein